MNLFEFERILNRYLKGKATEEEKVFIEHWLSIREADQRGYDLREKNYSKVSFRWKANKKSGLKLLTIQAWKRMIIIAMVLALLLAAAIRII